MVKVNTSLSSQLICSIGRHTLLLAQRYPALRLFGHDQSSYLISLARERALHSLPPSPNRTALPQFTVGDCRSVPYDSEDFNLVMVMGNSFGYFSANDVQNEGEDADSGDRAVLHEINRLLKKDGMMVLDLVDGGYMRENFSPRYSTLRANWIILFLDHGNGLMTKRLFAVSERFLLIKNVCILVKSLLELPAA